MSILAETGNGITIEIDGDYNDPEMGGGIYLSDKYGEIVMWDLTEVADEPAVIFPIVNAVISAFKLGPLALRQITGRACPECCPNKPDKDHCICGGR
jgi:hypothetical protein